MSTATVDPASATTAARLLGRTGQPFSSQALGTSIPRWALVLVSGAVLAATALLRPVPDSTLTGPGTTLAWAVFLAVLPLLAVVDARLRILPDRVTVPVALLVALLLVGDLASGALDPATLLTAVGSGLGLGAYAVILYVVAPVRGYGWGDVKFTALAGLVLGTKSATTALLGLVVLAPLLVVPAFLVALLRSRDGNVSMPYGPFLVAGCLTAALLVPAAPLLP